MNVPIEEEDIRHTIQSLPRTPTEAGIIPVQLKRKKNTKIAILKPLYQSPKSFRQLRITKHWAILVMRTF